MRLCSQLITKTVINRDHLSTWLIILQKEINECLHATLQMEELEEKRWKLLLEKDAMLSSKHQELAEARCKAEDKDQALVKALEVGNIGQGMRCCKCNSNSNVK
jgi:hypothetical protein